MSRRSDCQSDQGHFRDGSTISTEQNNLFVDYAGGDGNALALTVVP